MKSLECEIIMYSLGTKVIIMETVKIGNQEWSTLNLNVDRFNNGDIIPEIKTMEEWRTAALNKTPAWCYYDNNPENGVKFGRLYNWYAAIDPRGISPENFRIPTNDDINQLIINLLKNFAAEFLIFEILKHQNYSKFL